MLREKKAVNAGYDRSGHMVFLRGPQEPHDASPTERNHVLLNEMQAVLYVMFFEGSGDITLAFFL